MKSPLIPFVGKDDRGSHTPAHGAAGFCATPGARPKISIAFGQFAFDYIREQANRRRVPFARVVRELVGKAIVEDRKASKAPAALAGKGGNGGGKR
jgi:hypothetical protein